jgi:hypothetical protein
VKYWEIIADNLSKAGWSLGCVATVDANGQTIWIADAHRDLCTVRPMPAKDQIKSTPEIVLAKIFRLRYIGLTFLIR